MPSATRIARLASARDVPLRARAGVLLAAARRRTRPADTYRIRLGPGTIELSDADYDVDWETLKSAIADGLYATDYAGAVAIDLGAHKGYFGAYAIARGARAVVSHEPEPGNLAFLERAAASYRARGATWVVRSSAVGAARGRAELHVMQASWGHALEPPEDWSQWEIGRTSIDVDAMEDVVAEAATRYDRARLVVKMNIEGAECPLVLGTPADAWRRVDEVFVATHAWASCTDAELVAHLQEAGLRQVARTHPRVLRLRR